MKCPYCQSDTEVTNSRPRVRSNSVWRRLRCKQCKSLVTSIEEIDLSLALLVKMDDETTEPFSRDRLFISIYDACKHRSTPIADSRALTETIINRVCLEKTSAEIKRTELIKTALDVLESFDKAAATYFRAYHL